MARHRIPHAFAFKDSSSWQQLRTEVRGNDLILRVENTKLPRNEKIYWFEDREDYQSFRGRLRTKIANLKVDLPTNLYLIDLLLVANLESSDISSCISDWTRKRFRFRRVVL